MAQANESSFDERVELCLKTTVAKLTKEKVLSFFGENELDEIFGGDWDINDVRWQLACDIVEGNKSVEDRPK